MAHAQRSPRSAPRAAGAPPRRDPADATPVMRQFLEMKAAHPDHLLFFRMGDFYELFFEDAVLAAEALSIALTKRGAHGGEPIAMCGVPIHNAERYLHELIRAGFRVAVAEQMEDPAEAKKRGAKAVVKREIVRLVTPGTLTEDGLLEAGRHNYLAAFAEVRGVGALAAADISTGALVVGLCPAADLAGELTRLAAAEVVLAAPVAPALEAAAAEAGAAVAEAPTHGFEPSRAAARAAKALGAATLEGFGAFEPAETAALGALVDYIELTQRGRAPLLAAPTRRAPGGVMRIDPATRRNLEVLEAMSGGSAAERRAGALLGVVDRTRTSAGARLLAERLAQPLAEPTAIARRLDMVAYLHEARDLRARLREILAGAPDLERALARLGLGRGGPRDLAVVRDGLTAARALRDVLADLDGPEGIAAAAERLAGREALVGALRAALVESPPARLSDGGAIAPGADADLDAARSLRDDARKVIAGLEAAYREETEISALKIKHNNILGYFIETPATHGPRMMRPPLTARFRHRQTMANAMRFTTDRLAELEADIARAGDRARALEAARIAELTEAVLAEAEPIRRAAGALAALDVAAGHAELAETEGWRRPKIDDSRAFRIEGGRHPVVEAALRRQAESFVANDCDLSAAAEAGAAQAGAAEEAQPIWLVTGPNMAGKSTFLRQNALIAVLAQTGAFVPADSAHIGVVDQLFSRVGASDDLARGRSTFMVEMVETAAILNQAEARALVILDEIGRGTATFDGLSIAWAALEHLDRVNGCRALFATHYHELTALGAASPGMKNVTVAVREWKGDVVFLREIVAGAADRSYGLQVARLAGLPPAVLSRAKEILEMLETGAESPAARAAKLVEDLPLFRAAAVPPSLERPPEEGPALRHLRALDPDALTPRDALAALYELKKLLDEMDA